MTLSKQDLLNQMEIQIEDTILSLHRLHIAIKQNNEEEIKIHLMDIRYFSGFWLDLKDQLKGESIIMADPD